ncbi:MAG TPA: amidohydrolase, partial [Clostridiales bacterium]|nr:amidohydrolase [Clostridiales bacterium]
NALQTVVSRRISANDSAVLTIGTISGGTAANIIADQVKMMATLRTIDHATRENAKEWIAKIVQDISHGMGGSGETVITKGYDLLINDKQVNDVIAMAAKELLGEDQPAVNEETSLGVEDFCYFTQACKGAYYSLGCANPEKGFHAPGHNEKFDIDEDCLPIGVMAHVATTLKLLEMK